MASSILKTCTKCGDCETACPTKSIYPGVGQFVIDTDTCESCGACIPLCAVKAIVPPPSVEPAKGPAVKKTAG